MSVCIKQDGQLVKTAGLYSVTAPIGMADIYSTEEKEVGLWIDNKPLYQKSFYVDSLPSSAGTKTIATGLTNIDMCKITGGWSNGFGELNIVRCESSSAYSYGMGCWVAVVNGVPTINIEVGRDRSSIDAWVTLQYTKTTDTPWSGKFVPQGYGYVSSGDIYSFEERQVGVYTDGKPLYQKTVDLGTLTANNNKTVLYANVEISDVEAVVYFDVMINNQVNSNYNRPDSGTKEFYTQIVPTGIFIRAYDTAITSAYATLKYTKTTDVAGSGEYVPSGDKAKHYTADEHIIGTWTDGSTLYERTVRVPANTTGQNIITLWNDTNIQVRDYSGCFVFRASENTATLSCRPTDASYKLVVYTIGCSEQYGVYAEVDLGTQRGNAVDLMLTLKYIKVTS